MRTVFPLFLLVAVVAGCQKDKDDPPPPGNLPAYQYFVRSMEWDYGPRATVQYNADSTLQSLDYVYESSSGQVEYVWTNKQLTSMAYDGSLYKNTFHYDNGRLVKMVNASHNGSTPAGYQLEYGYGGNGRLTTLKYSTFNEAGTKLVYTTRYEYKANGELQAIISTQTNNAVIKYTIDSYSPEFELNPWLFVSVTLSEDYVLNNYPLLTQLNKLPAKMTKTVQEPGQASQIDKIEERAYTISNKRLDKIVTTLTYPDYPEYDQTNTTLFKY